MKRRDKIALIAYIVFTICFWLWASRCTPIIKVGQRFYADPVLETSPQAKLELEKDGYYGWASYENIDLNFGGQEAGEITLYGAGAGIKKQIKEFNFYVELGGYYPTFKQNSVATFNESMSIYLNQEVYPYERYWDFYEYSLKPGAGGTFGIEWSKQFGAFSLGFYSDYRYLKLKDDAFGYPWDDSPYWHIPGERNFGGFGIGALAEYTFNWGIF